MKIIDSLILFLFGGGVGLSDQTESIYWKPENRFLFRIHVNGHLL